MSRRIVPAALLVAAALATPAAAEVSVRAYPVPDGARPHDVAPNPDGGHVWYTAQAQGALGRLDPETGEVVQIELGPRSRPHGVIVGPKGVAWVTDSGQNAIVAVDPETHEVTRYPLPEGRDGANLNTAALDRNGMLWFTGQGGIVGRLDTASGKMAVFDAPRGYGPYGIDATPEGDIWYASLAGSYIARIDTETDEIEVVDPPTEDAGPRRIWSDSEGVLWVSEWNAGRLGRYDPEADAWREWELPGENPAAYAVYVDERDKVWLSDFGTDSVLRFDPETETFESFPIAGRNGDVRQMLGRKGEVWTAESASDHVTVYRYE